MKRLILILSALMLNVACSRGFVQTSLQSAVDSSSSTGFDLNNQYQAQALMILQNNCASCHGETSGFNNVYGLDDPNHMVASGLIVPGHPDQSLLYNSVASGSMPQGSVLSDSDIMVLQYWITDATPSTTTTTTLPPTTTTMPVVTTTMPLMTTTTTTLKVTTTTTTLPLVTTTTLPVTTTTMKVTTTTTTMPVTTTTLPPTTTTTMPASAAPTFTQLKTSIFAVSCNSCHSFSNYNNVIAYVTPGNAANSDLYTQVNTGLMPRGPTKLTSAQIKSIYDWIQAGAKNN